MGMTNPNGTKTSTAVVKWLRSRGWVRADRIPQKGSMDEGDVEIRPGWIAEIKYRGPGSTNAGLGQPGYKQLAGWMEEAEVEKRNRGAKHVVLVVKRKGTTNVGEWFAYTRMDELIRLVGGITDPDDHDVFVQMSFRDYTHYIR